MEESGITSEVMSQSLSSRAMSFDGTEVKNLKQAKRVSIPFEQGDVFRQTESLRLEAIKDRLNPFRAGRCLSTV